MPVNASGKILKRELRLCDAAAAVALTPDRARHRALD
jgi:hypothetical protein